LRLVGKERGGGIVTVVGGVSLTNRFFQFTIVALFAAFLAHAQVYGPPKYGPQQESPHSDAARRAAEMGTGKWWVKLSDEDRDKFIERYAEAMNRVSSNLFTDCADGMKGLTPNHVWKNGVREVDIMSNMILRKISSSFDFNFDRKEIREAVDEFYKDSTNPHRSGRRCFAAGQGDTSGQASTRQRHGHWLNLGSNVLSEPTVS
jgi:hypothetical protein